MKKFFEDKRPHNGKSYQEFIDETEVYLNSVNVAELDESAKGLFDYTKLNLQRSRRIEKTYSPSALALETIGKVSEPQLWMVITENWCGDSAQNLPYLAKLAEINPFITFRILERDKNLDIMEEYLTNGTMSIPIMVVFNENGEELFKWGPRPENAKKVIAEAKAVGLAKNEMYENLHKWYSLNKGADLEKEVAVLVEKQFTP